MEAEAVREEFDRVRESATLHAGILERLRDFLIEGNLAGGERVPEKRLCDEFGISRTPLREALKVLASEGLIELLPNRGARMRVLSEKDVRELFDLMGGLEALAGRLACERITDTDLQEIEGLHQEMYGYYLRGDRPNYFRCNQAIHEAVLRIAANDALAATYRNLSGRIRRFRYAANLDDRGERWSAAVREHELILDALRRRSGAELADILFDHLRHKQSVVVRKMGASQSADD